MTLRKAYSGPESSRGMSLILKRIFTLLFFLQLVMHTGFLFAQEEPQYDEISVFLEISGVGGSEIDALILKQQLYLPVTDLFDFLKIRNIPSPGLESVTGFFIDPEAAFNINRTTNQIRYQDKTYNLDPGDLIRTESNLYLKSSYFGKIFGLECTFNFRSLSVSVSSKLELPLIREMRQEEMRRNLTRLRGEIKADTSIGRSYPLFKFGMADWSVIATEEINGKSDSRFNLNLGAMIAGGEANASLYYSTSDPFLEKQQYYSWRYVNNDFKPLRQITAGKISTNAISSIFNPVVGVQFTNTPTTFRRSFGSYTLSDKTEPGWIVELYVNNVLVDYVKADASGFFKFDVPLVYGNSIVKLKFYSPWGEERTREQNINIPFNFLPAGTMEYTVSAGIVEDSLNSRYSQARVSYGLTRNLTLGGGAEYLSSITSGSTMPFLNASLRITNNLLLSADYTYGVRAKGTINYRLPCNLQFDLYYAWYEKDQKAIYFNYREERKAVVSTPLRIGKFSSFHRFSVDQIILPDSKYTTGEWLFSGSLFGLSTNLTTYALFIDHVKPYLYGNLSLALRLPGGYIIIPQAQYSYTRNELITARIGLEKHLFDHAYLNLSYEQNFQSNLKMAEFGLRYDFSFAQTGISARQSNNTTTLVQYARGSLINDRKTHYLGTDNRTNVGKGGITIVPFLDLNSNGKRDPGEPKVQGLNLHANGGRVEKSDRDSTIRILGLEPYTSCFIELDPNSFDNIAWRLPKQSLSVTVDPNILKYIEIPVSVRGEASGRVTLEENGEKRGLGRIIVTFSNSISRTIGRTLTEEDGYFSYFGFIPGSYSASVDTSQLNKLGMTADSESLQFRISLKTEGDIVSGLDFNLHKRVMEITDTAIQRVPEKPAIRKDTTFMIVHEVTEELVTISEDSYAIQLGAFRIKANADRLRRKLANLTDKKVEIIVENGYYKVRISEIKERSEVDAIIETLRKNGVTELWLISQKAMHKQLVLVERQDTIRKITETIIPNPLLKNIPEMTIQLGAFREKSNAAALLEKLSLIYGKNVLIVFEKGFYKLRLTGIPVMKQEVLDVMKKLQPDLGKVGIKDLWVLPMNIKPVEEPVVRVPVPNLTPARQVPEIPSLVQPQTHKLIIKKMQEVKTGPVYTLQVGTFYKYSQALRAQRRISSKLKIPAEIIRQWDYYRISIGEFYSREETYQYYPELAGLGYTRISIVEKK